MAHGIPCRNCGWQESPHEALIALREALGEEQKFLDEFDGSREKRDEYGCSFADCPGYVSEDAGLEARIQEEIRDQTISEQKRRFGNCGS